MKTNTYGYEMHGLRKAAGETKCLSGYRSGQYVQIGYDRRDGEILTNYHYSFGQNNWTQYHDPAIVTACNASSPMTMQEIADRITEAMTYEAVS